HCTASLLHIPRLPCSTLFPYTTLFRSRQSAFPRRGRQLSTPVRNYGDVCADGRRPRTSDSIRPPLVPSLEDNFPAATRFREAELDRKSTRLNSSHQIISYAVFCLKKKN